MALAPPPPPAMVLAGDRRTAQLQADPMQVRSLCEFTDSLCKELSIERSEVGTVPDKGLMRELLAPGLRMALELAGDHPKQRFMDALAVNIHRFPLQEQRSLARIFPVEVSAEYSNMASFVDDCCQDMAEDDAGAGKNTKMEEAKCTGPLAELRRRLQALPAEDGNTVELVADLIGDATRSELLAADSGLRCSVLGDVRLALCKFPTDAQRQLSDGVPGLRAEVARLLDTVTQEVARWLDSVPRGGKQDTPASTNGSTQLSGLKAILQAVLSPAFGATFKAGGGEEKSVKESLLLNIALCVKRAAELASDVSEEDASVLSQAAQIRMRFFHVEGYGELMEDWLQNRLKKLSEEFLTRGAEVLKADPQPILARLRRTFRPGKWVALDDAQVEDDLRGLLFENGNFPRHVLSADVIAKFLAVAAPYGGTSCEFQIYHSIARLAPTAPVRLAGFTPAPPQDAVEQTLLQVLQRLPPLPALRRMRPGHFRFGNLEVRFLLRGSDLLAHVPQFFGQLPEQIPAEEFFLRHGPDQFPGLLAGAVRLSLQWPAGAPSASIESAGAADPVGQALASAASGDSPGIGQAAGIGVPPMLPPPGPPPSTQIPPLPPSACSKAGGAMRQERQALRLEPYPMSHATAVPPALNAGGGGLVPTAPPLVPSLTSGPRGGLAPVLQPSLTMPTPMMPLAPVPALAMVAPPVAPVFGVEDDEI